MSEKENIREIILIGRGSESNFVADDASVSRQHAQIIDYGVYYTVVDLGSTNGTFVNGRRVTSETTLHAGDVLKVGNVVVPWEQIVQPPQKQKKTKVLLAILIPVIAVLLIGGGVTAGLIYWHGQNNTEVEKEQREEVIKKYAEQMDENKENAKKLDTVKKAKEELEKQKKAINEEKEAAIRAKAEAEREKEQAKKDAEQAKEEAKQAQAEVAKLKQEEKAKEEEQVKKVKAKKAEEEEQEKKVKAKKANEAEELRRTYNTLKDNIGKLDKNDAEKVCKALGMNEAANGAWPKTELLKEAMEAHDAGDSARLNKMMDEVTKCLK